LGFFRPSENNFSEDILQDPKNLYFVWVVFDVFLPRIAFSKGFHLEKLQQSKQVIQVIIDWCTRETPSMFAS
jgi:hypothetical protein